MMWGTALCSTATYLNENGSLYNSLRQHSQSSITNSSQALNRLLKRVDNQPKPQRHDGVAFLWESTLSSMLPSPIEEVQIPDLGICTLEVPASTTPTPPFPPLNPFKRSSPQPLKGVCTLDPLAAGVLRPSPPRDPRDPRRVAVSPCRPALFDWSLPPRFLSIFSVLRLVGKLVQRRVRSKKPHSKQRRNGKDIAGQSRQCWVEFEGERREKSVCRVCVCVCVC